MGHAQQKFIGFTAGATLSDVTNYYGGANTDSRWGGTASFIVGTKTYRQTAISLEPGWMQKGGGDLKADYLEVPIILSAAVRSGDGMMRYGFNTGIGIGFKLSCNDSSNLAFDPCKSMNDTDWFVPLGFRILRKVGSGGGLFGLDVRYAIPLDRSFDNSDIYTRPWSFRLIYLKGKGIQ